MAMGSNVANTGGGEEDQPETGFEQIGANFYDWDRSDLALEGGVPDGRCTRFVWRAATVD